MQIALLVIITLNMILSIVNLILIIDRKKKGKKVIPSRNDLTSISENIIEDLTTYCKETYNLDVFPSTEGDQISLACHKDDKTVEIIQLRFPMSPRDTPDYNSTLEYQKEEIDEWSRKNA